jgi:hypothetical protein
MSGGTGISEVFSKINKWHWRKVEIKYAKNIVEDSKDKKKRMDRFEDTTGNNACTLGYHHDHHQSCMCKSAVFRM